MIVAITGSVGSFFEKIGETFSVYSVVLLSYLQPFLNKVIEWIINYSVLVYGRLLELLGAPRAYPEMMWILTPLLLTMLLMEFYFARYKEELLGWNTAFGNSLVLIFVSIDLVRHLYNSGRLFQLSANTIIVLGIVILGLFLIFVDFFHLLPPRLAFNISSKLRINFLACFAVVSVYANISIDVYTVSALVLIFVCLLLFVGLMHLIMPGVAGELTKEAPEPLEDIQDSEEDIDDSEEEI